MALHHTEDPVCPLCEAKIRDSHPAMASWFREKKKVYQNLHTSCSFRGKVDQDSAFKEGKSKLKWPHSAHNRVNPRTAKPESLALDLFQIDEVGNPRWSPLFFAMLNRENRQDRCPIRWGGDFRTLGDSCHFEWIGKLTDDESPQSAA